MTVVAERKRSLPGVSVFGLAAVALIAVVAGLRVSCGSFHAGMSYLSGNRLLADAASKSVGEVAIEETAAVRFLLSNRSDRTITILGAKTSCTCAATRDLPMTLPPSSQRTLGITYKPRPGTKPGEVAESLRLYTDYPAQATLPLLIVGRVGPSRANDTRSSSPIKTE